MSTCHSAGKDVKQGFDGGRGAFGYMTLEIEECNETGGL